MQPPLVVGEDEEVIDVADVAQPEMVGDEVVERVEVDVGEKLASLVARQRGPACGSAGVNRSSPGNQMGADIWGLL